MNDVPASVTDTANVAHEHVRELADECEYVPVPTLGDNYVWVVCKARAALVVDPGEAAPVRHYLAKRGWRLAAILLTHHHHDHVGGVAELLADASASASGDAPADARACGGASSVPVSIPVYGPASEQIACVTHPLAGGERVRVEALALDFDVLAVPGHTRGHLAYFQAATPSGAPHLFCGDALFSCGCGRIFEGTPAQMLASLDALAALPDATRVHCAHEYTLSNIRFALACDPDNARLRAWHDEAAALRAQGAPTLPTTLARERAVNPFLRAGDPAIQAVLARELHQAVPDRLGAFTLMREWKNRFQ